jgi:hypothetical protein
VDDDTGSPLAILVNYACHPVIFGPDNRLYSSDFPGVMTDVVEKALGSKVMAFFLQGADGDINPYYAVTPLSQGAVEFRQRAGTELGVVAARVAQQIHTTADDHASLQLTEDHLTFRPRWNAQQWQAADPQNAKGIADKTKAQYELPVTTLLINQQIAFLTMPGEPFVDLQTQWRARCPVRDCFFLGYTNGYHGYFPTVRAAIWGGYGAAHPSTWIEVGAGEQMLNHGLVRVYEMLGRVRATPEDLQP